MATKRIKYIGINQTEEVNDLYAKHYKTLLIQVKENLNTWEDVSCSWTGKLDTVK